MACSSPHLMRSSSSPVCFQLATHAFICSCLLSGMATFWHMSLKKEALVTAVRILSRPVHEEAEVFTMKSKKDMKRDKVAGLHASISFMLFVFFMVYIRIQ